MHFSSCRPLLEMMLSPLAVRISHNVNTAAYARRCNVVVVSVTSMRAVVVALALVAAL